MPFARQFSNFYYSIKISLSFFLVVSHDVTIYKNEMNASHGVIHIFPDKVVVTQGFPPDINIVLTQLLKPGSRNETKCVGEQGLWFCTKPDICVFSEHRDNIWKTLLRCMNEYELTTVSSKPVTRHCPRKTYQNLSRPCCNVYMNVKDTGQEQYINMFSMSDTIYQNWKNNRTSDDIPPPCPPRRPPPPLPPRPRNRPPNSPLPPIPCQTSNYLQRQNLSLIPIRSCRRRG